MTEQMLSLQQIGNKYKGEWLFLIDCVLEDNGKLASARVALHNSNRDEVYKKLIDFKGYRGKSALIYTGEIPKDLTVVLWLK